MNDPKYGIRDGRLWHKHGEYFLPEDEPVTLLRGKDPAVPIMLTAYIAHLLTLDTTDPRISEHLHGAINRLCVVTKWQQDNPQRVTNGCHNC